MHFLVRVPEKTVRNVEDATCAFWRTRLIAQLNAAAMEGLERIETVLCIDVMSRWFPAKSLDAGI
jgi:hypothetical protein